MVNDYKIRAVNTLQGYPMSYTVPIMKTSRSAGESGGTTIALDKPVNNQVFTFSGKRESGSLQFEAFEKFNPSTVDSVESDRSYDSDLPVGERHTLDYLIDQLSAGSSSEQAEAEQLKQRFGQDSNGNYVVRTVEEQRIWVREYVHNPGLRAEGKLFGPTYSYRTVDGSNNPTGTPIFIESADIEPDPNTTGRGTGNIQFKIGGRL